MNWAQKLYRFIRYKGLLKIFKDTPIVNFILQPQINRYFFYRISFIFFVVIPSIGIFRRTYIKRKFNDQLKSKSETTEIQLKQSMAQFDIKAQAGIDYIVIVTLSELKQKEENEISEIDKENSSKIFNLLQQAGQDQSSHELKWAFLGSKKLYEAIQNSRNLTKLSGDKLQVQFYEDLKPGRQAKIFLVAKQEEGEKVIMEWNAGVPYRQITKYIAKHKYKKYLKEITF